MYDKREGKSISFFTFHSFTLSPKDRKDLRRIRRKEVYVLGRGSPDPVFSSYQLINMNIWKQADIDIYTELKKI